LALAQTALVLQALEQQGLRCEVITIRTEGDRHPDRPTRELGAGAFVSEIEAALADGRIDLAVHSAKDLHGESTSDLELAAFLPREDPLDVLVARDGATLTSLPAGARVGTESPRRRAFLVAARPDLDPCGIRGNVDTRLRKLDAGDVDALVLAAAGLNRLGLSHRITERLDPAVMLPEAGQGAIAVQARSAAGSLAATLAAIDHHRTRAEVEAERAFVAALGGDCQSAIGALGAADRDTLRLNGAVLDPDGTRILRDCIVGLTAHAAEVGRTLASTLLQNGARSLMAGATR